MRRGVPAKRVGGRLVTTVLDLALAQYGVGRDGLPGEWPSGYDDASSPLHAGLAGADHRRRRRPLHADRPRVRRQRRAHRRPLDDRHGRRDQPLVPLRPDLPGDARARPLLRLPGSQRRRLGPLRRPGEGPADHRLVDGRVRARLVAAAAPAAGDALLVPGDRPVALRDLRHRGVHLAGRQRRARQAPHGRLPRARRPARLAAVATRRSTATRSTSPTRRRRRASSPPTTSSPSSRPAGSASPARTPTTRPTSRGCCRCGARTCSAPRARATSTSSATCSASPTRPSARRSRGPSTGPEEVKWHDEAPVGKLDLFTTLDFRMNGSCIYSDVVLPAATWYEKHDISSTDLHPFVHPFNAAIPPPWETKTDWDAFNRIATEFSRLAEKHLGTRTDLVAAPLLHDTPDELAQPLGKVRDWRAGECEPIPGKTMPKLVPVERDFTAVAEKMKALGPLVEKAGHRRQGRLLEAGARGRRAGPAQRPRQRRRAGRRAAVAEPRRRRLRGDPRAVGNDQRPPRGRELPRARAPDRARARGRPGRARRGAADVRGDRDPAAQGDRLGRVVGPRVARAPLLARSPRTSTCSIPWRTLTGRQQLFVDHEWMLDLGEGAARLPAAGRRRTADRPRRQARRG